LDDFIDQSPLQVEDSVSVPPLSSEWADGIIGKIRCARVEIPGL